ncbi:PREDICTED: uncharacterized protein LOC104804623 [Tarenaya hassleriana]|uniref:uncharacterized protein LOC104804623 n=1 Tax=Tarenaya hassleriana TaxID=28532 RepID=UPI00053C6753|nr:PREDICTED: uncharacterized protein LOC104804623 [Tarenaya hassleriana]
MESGDRKDAERANQPPSPSTPIPPSPSFFDNWKERILIPTLLAGAAGGGVGLVSKHRKAHPNIPATFATNFAIVAGCYCGAREFVRVTRKSEHDDLMNSVIGGSFSGALLGRLQGGPRGAFRYSLIFAVAGTAFDYATMRSKPLLQSLSNFDSLKLPEWSPIQILDEEALAKKKAREQKLFGERTVGRLNKEES